MKAIRMTRLRTGLLILLCSTGGTAAGEEPKNLIPNASLEDPVPGQGSLPRGWSSWPGGDTAYEREIVAAAAQGEDRPDEPEAREQRDADDEIDRLGRIFVQPEGRDKEPVDIDAGQQPSAQESDEEAEGGGGEAPERESL